MTHASRTLSLAIAALCGSVLTTSRVGSAQPSAGPVPPVKAARLHASGNSSMFAPSTECLACHNNLIGPDGEDVSIGASWRGTMMANSARDPYVLASVRRETMDHAARAGDIEDECAACHAPAARHIAHGAGAKATMLSTLAGTDTGPRTAAGDLGRDGVTCTVCHQIAADRLGTSDGFNGNFVIAPPLASGRRRAFGPFSPDAGRRRIMHSVTGFEQEQAAHIRESAFCATCHTLVTEALGPDGRVIGALPEQMNYQEWRHSAFVQERRGCQSCHMPAAPGPVRVSSVLGEQRDSLSRHVFVGGNAFMLRLMNRYRDALGLEATSTELEATAAATIRQLERDTATVAIGRAEMNGGILAFDVVVRNLAGHKFPSGYPSRRAWLHITVRDAAGRRLFESGRVTETGAIDGNDSDGAASTFEPHYQEITRASEVQIYESIMGTPAGLPTTGLLQATRYLKDNRLLPRGFEKSTAQTDIAVVGSAAEDQDFVGGEDVVRYRIPFTGSAKVTIDAELRFQPIGYRWAHNLASYDAHEPRAFLSYYRELAASSSVAIVRASQTIVQ